MFNQEIFCKNLKLLEEAKNWNSSQLAKEVHMTEATISRWKSGDRLPSIPALWKIADVFGISIDQLVGREPLPDWAKKGRHN